VYLVYVNAGGAITANHGILDKIDRIILHLLTQTPDLLCHWLAAEPWYPRRNVLH
jgi:hypothetical protein